MRKFYIKNGDCYLMQVGIYEWFANKPVYTTNKANAGKFTDAIYNNIKSKLPSDHTLELVVCEKSTPKWVKNAIASMLIYFLCCVVVALLLKTQTFKVCFIFLTGFFSNDIARWITNR